MESNAEALGCFPGRQFEGCDDQFFENLVIAMVIMLILKANEQFRAASPGRRWFFLMLALQGGISIVIE
jgi:hypothetical protein